MSAEVLRQAAALMRSRAEAATPGPWQCDEGSGINDLHFGHVAIPVLRPLGTYGPKVEDVRHVAGMHPAVALAVADWLEATADHADATGGHCVCDDAALAVARAYLGKSS